MQSKNINIPLILHFENDVVTFSKEIRSYGQINDQILSTGPMSFPALL